MCLHCTCVCACVCPRACAHTQSSTRKDRPCWAHSLLIIFGADSTHRMGCQSRNVCRASPKRHSQGDLVFPSASFLPFSPPSTSGRALSSFQNALCRPPYPLFMGTHPGGIADGSKLGDHGPPGSAREEVSPLPRRLAWQAGPQAKPAGLLPSPIPGESQQPGA